jgi:hypothetical protein
MADLEKTISWPVIKFDFKTFHKTKFELSSDIFGVQIYV